MREIKAVSNQGDFKYGESRTKEVTSHHLPTLRLSVCPSRDIHARRPDWQPRTSY